MKYAIRYEDGSFYRGQSGIGPMFGTRDQAKTFKSRADAARLFMTHFAFGDCEVVQLPATTPDHKELQSE